MSTASRPFHDLPAPVKRLLYGAACVMLFVGVSAVVNPDRSMADDRELAIATRGQAKPQTTQATEPAPAGTTIQQADQLRQSPDFRVSNRPLIGTLTGSPFFIWVYAGTTGPVYTVADNTGRVLAQELGAEALYAQLPQVAVEHLQLVPQSGSASPGPLMLADPDKQQAP